MNKKINLIYLILILTLNFSCVAKKSSEKEVITERAIPVKTGALTFTSGIRAIFQDRKGNYWLGSHNEGVCYFNGQSFQYFSRNEGLPDNQVRSIEEDKNGNIWLETASGVSMYNGERFTHYATNINTKKLDWCATNGDLWFTAGNNEGINRFDGVNMNYLVFPKPRIESPDVFYTATDIAKDKQGKVWIATYTALFSYDNKNVVVYDKNKLALKKDEQLHIRSVFADSKGRTWIGNNGIGVLLLEGNTAINFSDKNGLIHKNSTKNGNRSPAGTLEHVFVIQEDAEGNIWFGDRDTGPWKFDGKTMTNYTVDAQLKSAMVWSIYSDHNKNLLFGMAGGGVYKFNGKSFSKMF